MKGYCCIFLVLISSLAGAQVQQLHPTLVESLSFSLEGEKAFEKNLAAFGAVMEKLNAGTKEEDLSTEEIKLLNETDEASGGYWAADRAGCSWYCGGGPNKVTASSYLNAQGNNQYGPQNAHDLDYKTAWVEGRAGYGIGEYLLYTFAAEAPRITTIIVANGYVKSEAAWKNNSRVKQLKMYVNNQEVAILNLKDQRAKQSFEVDAIGNNNRSDWDALKNAAPWSIKFEILDVYKGLKYDDVALSEVFFDGLDVHCFAAGTKVLLSDRSEKNIEALMPGDSVMGYNIKSGTMEAYEIEKLEQAAHSHLVQYQFKSGRTITATHDHPFYVKGKGWAALHPKQTQQYRGLEQVQLIEIGDELVSSNGAAQLTGMVFMNEGQTTYTISKLKGGNNFIANGLVVGVEEQKEVVHKKYIKSTD